MGERKRWFIVGFISALACFAIAKAFGLHPGESKDPIATAMFLALITWLAFVYAIGEDRHDRATHTTEKDRG